jgi:hypothetical protein
MSASVRSARPNATPASSRFGVITLTPLYPKKCVSLGVDADRHAGRPELGQERIEQPAGNDPLAVVGEDAGVEAAIRSRTTARIRSSTCPVISSRLSWSARTTC